MNLINKPSTHNPIHLLAIFHFNFNNYFLSQMAAVIYDIVLIILHGLLCLLQASAPFSKLWLLRQHSAIKTDSWNPYPHLKVASDTTVERGQSKTKSHFLAPDRSDWQGGYSCSVLTVCNQVTALREMSSIQAICAIIIGCLTSLPVF